MSGLSSQTSPCHEVPVLYSVLSAEPVQDSESETIFAHEIQIRTIVPDLPNMLEFSCYNLYSTGDDEVKEDEK